MSSFFGSNMWEDSFDPKEYRDDWKNSSTAEKFTNVLFGPSLVKLFKGWQEDKHKPDLYTPEEWQKEGAAALVPTEQNPLVQEAMDRAERGARRAGLGEANAISARIRAKYPALASIAEKAKGYTLGQRGTYQALANQRDRLYSGDPWMAGINQGISSFGDAYGGGGLDFGGGGGGKKVAGADANYPAEQYYANQAYDSDPYAAMYNY